MKTSIILYPYKKTRKQVVFLSYMRVITGKTKSKDRLDADLSEKEIEFWEEFAMRLKDNTSRVLYLSATK
jgi:hypothetical protein